MEKIIEHLDTDQLLKASRHFFHLIRKSIEVELKALELKKHQLMEKIILETDDFTNWRENPHYVDLYKLENEEKEFLNQIEEKKDLLLENEGLVGLIKDYLHKCRQANSFFLTSVLIRSLCVYPNEVNIEVSKFDYLQDFQSQYIFNGDDLL